MLKLIFCKHFKFSGNFNVLVDKFIFVKKCASLMHENLSISFLHVYHVEKSFLKSSDLLPACGDLGNSTVLDNSFIYGHRKSLCGLESRVLAVSSKINVSM